MQPGDLLLVDKDAGNGGGVIHVNAVTGAHTLALTGGAFDNPRGIVLSPSGKLFLTDSGSNTQRGDERILEVDLMTGGQRLIALSGFIDPLGIALAANGLLFVVDRIGAKIVQVDPFTEAQHVIPGKGAY